MTRNIAASVHQRLLNYARAEGRPFNEVLQYFALERFLYRLGRSPYAEKFVLKGALMFNVWQGVSARATRDVDLLGHLDNQVSSVVQAIQAVCQEQPPEDDGLRFDAENIEGVAITEAAHYQGVRVRLFATLGNAHIRLQVDVGFGDILVPGPKYVQLPTILNNFPPPELQGYSQRQTPLQVLPVAFTPEFTTDPEKQAQWQAFVRRLPHALSPPTLDAWRTVARGRKDKLNPLISKL